MVVAEDPDELPLKPVLAGDQLMEAQTTQLQQILEGAEGTFRDEPGLTAGCEHIKTGDALPIRSGPYAISPKKLEGVSNEISSLLEKGIIVPSTSQWSSPIVPLIKPDGSIRLCVDFRKLNAITQPDPYCMPLVEELIARVGEAKYLSKMDLSKGFYQVPLAEEDRENTAFVTTGGKFEFTRMPFGLRNALATFQRLVDRVLGGLEAFAAPYIDDIIIFSNDCKQHFGHIREVIGRLQQAGLTAMPAQCKWAKRTLEFLGHVVGYGLVSVPEAKVEALRNYKRPKTKAQLKSFLGLTGYYRCFIFNYANYSKPLNAKTKAEAPLAVDWDEVSVSHFSHLCSVLCSACTLHIPSPSDKFVLQTDASYAGIGGCLSVMRDGVELPVAFYSRQLRDPETRYSVTEVECLAVVVSVRHFEVYLDG